MILIIETIIVISIIIIFFVAKYAYNYKKRYINLENSYNKLVGNYAAILKRIELYEIVLTNKGCTEAIDAAAEMEIQENNL